MDQTSPIATDIMITISSGKSGLSAAITKKIITSQPQRTTLRCLIALYYPVNKKTTLFPGQLKSQVAKYGILMVAKGT